MEKEIQQKIKEADMVLVGIGEEFEEERYLKTVAGFQTACSWLIEQNMEWMVPALKRSVLQEAEDRLPKAYEALNRLLEGKNYFVLTTAADDFIWDCGLNPERIAAPCGGSRKTQCVDGCAEGLQELTEKEREASRKKLLELLTAAEQAKLQVELPFQKKQADHNLRILEREISGTEVCPVCGKPLVLNNIHNEHYDENGYLPEWQLYTKWLQGTLNRKLCVLELGVGMYLPNIIRWPFEKAAYFNQKASFIRVNERLYQLSEELGEKGISIAQNAVDWLLLRAA